jgi:phosphate transport system permease protein
MPTLTEQPPAAPARAIARKTSLTVRLVDKLTTFLITTGGLMVIVAVVGIMVYLVSVVIPLFRGASVQSAGNYSLLGAGQVGDIRMLLVDEHQEHGVLLDRKGHLTAFDVSTGKILSNQLVVPETPAITAFTRSLRGDNIGFGFADGTIRLGRLKFTRTGAETVLDEPLLVGNKDVAVARLDYKVSDRREVVTVLKDDGELYWDEVTRRENIMTGKVTTKLTKHQLPFKPPADKRDLPLHLLQNAQGDQVYLAWRDGTVQRYDLRQIESPVIAETSDFTPEPGVELTSLQFMFGDQSIIAGDANGGVTAWFRVQRPDAGTQDGYQLVPAHQLRPHSAPVISADMSTRDKTLVTGTADGSIWVRHMTSHQVLGQLAVPGNKPVAHVHLTPKGDGLIALDATGHVWRWSLHNPHPETTWTTIFGKVWYEGYDRPDYTWQSSSGNDDFEPKFSLIPLAFGTLKATFYSMMFAVPIALLAAIYTSQFLDKRLRAPIKSAVETMASLPSVVLGFIAALVLAPVVENRIMEVIMIFFALPVMVVLGGYLWQMLPVSVALRLEGWPKFLLLIVAVAAALAVGLLTGGPMESIAFNGDFMAWLDGRVGDGAPGNALLAWPFAFGLVWFLERKLVADAMACALAGRRRAVVGLSELAKMAVMIAVSIALAVVAGLLLAQFGYDPRGGLVGTYVQRNTMVVGFVMGFAVIPIIYTISEDALSSVPEQLKSASLGCGATPWQTAIRVILPVAMSGIFSAVMIGLGRAVGETMIVVMAAGNTPVMDINVFNGLRALSANIAVELPEAVKDSTLYRMLFLAALTLFIMTFALNTVAEIIRQRFRKRAFQL